MQTSDLVAIAHAVADAARPVPMRYFRKSLRVEHKADLSPVTIADRETEKAMRAVLHDRCPDHGIFGEEHGGQHLDARFVWVLDPIDGTKSFITGFPLFCSLVALLDGGRPIVGIVDVPAIGERYTAAVGAGASFDGEPIRTSGCEQLDDAVVYLAGHEPTDAELDRRFRAFRDVGRLQRYGYDAFVYALLAAGHVDVMIETDLQPYDFLSLVPLVEEAGGRITDWSGAPLSLSSKGDVVASATPALHEAVLRRLSGAGA